MAVIVETGCWGCAGYPTGLVRIYRDSSGQIRSEELLTAEQFGLPSQVVDGPEGAIEKRPFITNIVSTPDASVLATSVCVRGGECGPGGLANWQADAIAVIYRSTSGGIGWEEIGRGGPALEVVGVLNNGEVLTSNYLEPLGSPTWAIFPGNLPVQPPEGGAWPVPASNEVLWSTNDGRLIASDGTEFAKLEGLVANSSVEVLGIFNWPTQGTALVAWDRSDIEPPEYHISQLNLDLSKTSVTRLLTAEQSLVYLGSWSDTTEKAVISVEERNTPDAIGTLPAILDLKSGIYQLITDAFTSVTPPYRPYGRALVHAVQIGPFARVVGTGSCLNIRAMPSQYGDIVTCASDGVLLYDSIERRSVDGTIWIRVATPQRATGWASSEFLER